MTLVDTIEVRPVTLVESVEVRLVTVVDTIEVSIITLVEAVAVRLVTLVGPVETKTSACMLLPGTKSPQPGVERLLTRPFIPGVLFHWASPRPLRNSSDS